MMILRKHVKPFRKQSDRHFQKAMRWLNIYEFQAKQIMEKYKVRVQKGDVSSSPEKTKDLARRLLKESFSKLVIVKAQVLAGGRGKGHFEDGFKGGIHVLKSAESADSIASKMLNKRLVTKQTGSKGELVRKLLVLDGLDFEKEAYFAILLDRQHNGPVLVGSPMGGVDIEEVAVSHPEAILKIPVSYQTGVTTEQAAKMAAFLQFAPATQSDAAEQIKALYELFVREQATQVEINPLVAAKDDSGVERVFAVDAKLNFDDNALTEFVTMNSLREKSEESKTAEGEESKGEEARVRRAKESNLSFIPLDGTIGCMVNGAGLAMATMDIIKLKGGQPANFLDVGGGANEEQVKTAFELIMSDKRVKGILVNIFGGIMRCDVIARGIVNAARATKLEVPLIVRLEGTNSEQGKKILAGSGLSVKTASSLDEAAEKAVLFSK